MVRDTTSILLILGIIFMIIAGAALYYGKIDACLMSLLASSLAFLAVLISFLGEA